MLQNNLNTCPALIDIPTKANIIHRYDDWFTITESGATYSCQFFNNRLLHRFLLNMTDRLLWGPSPLSGPSYVCERGQQWNTVGESSGVEGRYQRERLELMVLHLPGSMSIMALITLSKESISLFSFLLHRRSTGESWKALLMQCVCITDTSICSQIDPNKTTWEVYLQYNLLSISFYIVTWNMMCVLLLLLLLFWLCRDQCPILGTINKKH